MKHRHHIVPKHAGGTNDPSNIVHLTVEEHAEAHRLLYEQHGRWQDWVAWNGLAGLIGKDEIMYIVCSSFRGRKHTPEALAKMSRPKTKEHAAKVGLTKRGKPRTDETKRKISEARIARGYKPTPEQVAKLTAFAKLPKSPETRAKMSEARRLYWERKRSA